MQLKRRQMLLISFMLFSLFFGAGNLIFPPFLGQNAGNHTPVAFIGFMLTAVILPVLGVITVAKFGGLENLGRLVSPKFSIVFTVIIYLSIGPGLGIPRAASVPFEMAIAPYLPEGSNLKLFMALYSFIFFAIALWLCLTPGKLVRRIGTFLTPSLLTLIVVLFISFLVKGQTNVHEALGSYENGAFMQGFVDGYQTMDAIAALNFGLVIATTLDSFGVDSKKGVMKHTVFAGLVAGSILTLVYVMLAYIGAQSSGVYPPDGNGAVLLRLVVQQIFGTPGAILLAAIFTLACLTTCVGLINSISAYFSTLFKKVSYRKWVILITVVSFLICNLGLNTILSISVPVLNIVYPISIMLIFFGLTSKVWTRFRMVYPAAITGTAVVSIFHSIFSTLMEKGVDLGGFGVFLENVPLFKPGFFWVIAVAVVMAITMLVYLIYYKTHPLAWKASAELKESDYYPDKKTEDERLCEIVDRAMADAKVTASDLEAEGVVCADNDSMANYTSDVCDSECDTANDTSPSVDDTTDDSNAPLDEPLPTDSVTAEDSDKQ